jgi:hypothetical protein
LERPGESLVEILDLARSLVMVDIVVCDGDAVTGLLIWLEVGTQIMQWDLELTRGQGEPEHLV